MRQPIRLVRQSAARSLFALIALAAMLAGAPAHAQAITTSAEYAILIDADTNTVLFEKNADELMAPASMSKLMTMAVVFDALKKGEISLEDELHVSERAWREGGATSGGSSMFAKLNDSIKVSDLIRGVIVQSGNDASIVFAEGLAGSEEAFADRMTRFARQIGLEKSTFTNATGLPDPEHRMTARELAELADYIINQFPDLYAVYSEPEFTWNGIRQFNRNPALRMNIGADGLKTGYTEESGYGLVASAVQDGQRLILVVNGLDSAKERAEEARKLLTWGFRSFDQVTLFEPGEAVGAASVFGGTTGRVNLRGDGAVKMLKPRGEIENMEARIVYTGPVMAPVAEGDRIGVLRVSSGDRLLLESPLFAAHDVPRGPIHRRAMDALWELAANAWNENIAR